MADYGLPRAFFIGGAMICSRAELLVYLKKTATIAEADLALLDMLHPMAEQALKDTLENDLEYALHTEYLPIGKPYPARTDLADYDWNSSGRVVPRRGNRNSSIYLQLKHTPVWLAGLEVWEDLDAYAGQATGSFEDDDKLTVGDDYYLDLSDQGTYSESGMLINESGWPTEPRTVKVTYYGGWKQEQLSSVASAIKMAAILTVTRAFNEARTQATTSGAGAITEEDIGKYRVKYDQGTSSSLNGMVISVPPEALNLVARFKNYGRYLA